MMEVLRDIDQRPVEALMEFEVVIPVISPHLSSRVGERTLLGAKEPLSWRARAGEDHERLVASCCQFMNQCEYG